MFTDGETALMLAYTREQKHANGIIDRQEDRIAKQAKSIQERDDLILKLSAKVEELRHSLRVQTAHSAGLVAQRRAMEKVHHDSPLLKPTGRRYDDGRPENQLFKPYDEAFDARARELGLSDPEKLRENAK